MSDHTTQKHDDQTSWRDKTLKAAGYGYLIGDAAFAVSGLIKGEKGSSILRTGAIWSAGGVGAAIYGNPDTAKQLDILAHRLEHYLKKNGAVITDDVRDRSELLQGKNGLGAKLDRFMYEHPTELLNGSYAIGAAGLLYNGIKNFGEANKKTTAAMGALVLAGALCGLLIKEDPDARSKVDQNSIVSRVVGYIKEKPMRLAGAFYWANNGIGIMNAKQDMSVVPKFGMKAHWFSFLTVASYIASNGLLALSARDQIEEKKFKPEHVAQLEQVAAEIIAAQPPQVQGALLTNVSEYLAKEKMVSRSSEELSKDLIARVSESSKRHLAHATETKWAEKAAKEKAATAAAVVTLA